MSDSACDIVIVDLPDSDGQVYVRRWAESGEYEADWRPNHSATWVPVQVLGGDYRVETVE